MAKRFSQRPARRLASVVVVAVVALASVASLDDDESPVYETDSSTPASRAIDIVAEPSSFSIHAVSSYAADQVTVEVQLHASLELASGVGGSGGQGGGSAAVPVLRAHLFSPDNSKDSDSSETLDRDLLPAGTTQQLVLTVSAPCVDPTADGCSADFQLDLSRLENQPAGSLHVDAKMTASVTSDATSEVTLAVKP